MALIRTILSSAPFKGALGQIIAAIIVAILEYLLYRPRKPVDVMLPIPPQPTKPIPNERRPPWRPETFKSSTDD